jgi:hypothetical protein
MMFEVGDYIEFTRIVHGKRGVRHRTDYDTGRAIVVPEIPEQVLPQGGEGQVVGPSRQRRVNGESYTTASVYAGKPLGKVIAILDDAILVGKQQSLFEVDEVKEVGPNVYGSDAKGIA